MSFKSTIFTILFLFSFLATNNSYAEEELTPNEVLDSYFKALAAKDADALQALFAENAVVATAAGEHRGHEAIIDFYRRSIFQCEKFKPHPGNRLIANNQVAVEMYLDCDGDISKVGDFFTIKNGKLIRLAVYSGPGYFPIKSRDFRLPTLRP